VVGHAPGDAVTRRDAHSRQRCRRAADLVVETAVGEPGVAPHHGFGVGPPRERDGERFGHRLRADGQTRTSQ